MSLDGVQSFFPSGEARKRSQVEAVIVTNNIRERRKARSIQKLDGVRYGSLSIAEIPERPYNDMIRTISY